MTTNTDQAVKIILDTINSTKPALLRRATDYSRDGRLHVQAKWEVTFALCVEVSFRVERGAVVAAVTYSSGGSMDSKTALVFARLCGAVAEATQEVEVATAGLNL